MNPEYVAGLFGVSLVVSALAIACDLKWRKYPTWAFGVSFLLIIGFWFLFMRQEGWLTNLGANYVNIYIMVIVGSVIFTGAWILSAFLPESKFGGGDAKLLILLSLLLPTAHVWLGTETIFPQTHTILPVDFWANLFLFWGIIVLIHAIAERLWSELERRVIPLAPLIVGVFYLTIWYGGIWRGVVDPIIPIILGG